MKRHLLPTLLLLLTLPALRPAAAQPSGAPTPDAELAEVERVSLPAVDADAIRRADERRVREGRVPHFAVALEVAIDPWSHGRWEAVGGERVRWRLRLDSRDALSLSLAFTRYRMPAEGELTVATPDGRYRVGPFTDADVDAHGQLWTPPIPGDELLLDLTLPVDRLAELELELTRVHHGYAGFGAPEPKAGACHLDVACPEAEGWSDQARSVALISIAGVRFCTGFLVNNTAHDGRPFFITARHCGVSRRNAPSVVVTWGYRRPGCGPDATAATPSHLQHFQSGAVLRAEHASTDVTLLELDDPPAPEARVFYAGWDRRDRLPRRTVTIHHPNTGVQRISFDFDPAVATWHLRDQPTPYGNHLRIDDWEVGTTEGGSSGAPLFNADRRVVGQLHGGWAACDDRRPDWFGRFSKSWDGDGRPGTRLSDWLDPIASGAPAIDGIDASEVPSPVPSP